jgi:signal transduction histidine kinase/ActR/RegA family two-component response regulator
VARDITAQKRSAAALESLTDELAVQLADLRRLQEMSMRLATTRELQPILEDTLRTAAAIEGTPLGVLSLYDAESDRLRVGVSLGLDQEFLDALSQLPPGGAACTECLRKRRRVVVVDVMTEPRFAAFRNQALREEVRAIHCTPLVARSGTIVGVLTTYFREPRKPTDRESHMADLCARQAADFIENVRLYQALREADRRKDEFLAVLAHELRNPLAPISNSLHLLRMTDDVSLAAERIHQIMEQHVDHLIRLVDDLLEVSRITRGRIELRRETVELAAVVRSAVDASRSLIDAAGHQLALTLPAEPVLLDADPVRLAQVISNLLNNAAKYTDRGGQIWLSARVEDRQAVISVRDTGVGIPPAMLPHVFEMFAQVDRTLHRAQGGLGIGLALARSLVQMHGGEILVRSGGAGQGSEFVVRLPRLSEAERKVSLPPPRESQFARPLPARSIVVVDDERSGALVLGELLVKMGQHVQTAHDAETALAIAEAARPDVIVSDIGMPNVDGYELARRVRQHPLLRGVALVALTGYGQDIDRQRARDAGFDHHLVKPASFEALHALLAALPVREAEPAPTAIDQRG